MRNIIRFSNDYPDGDNFGKDTKISVAGYTNLFDLFENAFGQYKDLSYPLTDVATLDSYVSDLTTKYPKSNFTSEINDETKNNWSEESFKIGQTFAYGIAEITKLQNQSEVSDYVEEGKEIVNRQLVLAGYRLSYLCQYMASKQKPSGQVIASLLK
jgi:hypothetical protein